MSQYCSGRPWKLLYFSLSDKYSLFFSGTFSSKFSGILKLPILIQKILAILANAMFFCLIREINGLIAGSLQSV